MATAEQQARLLEKLVEAHANIAVWKAQRVKLMGEARAAGITWRRCALALDMTVEGVTRILERARRTGSA